MLRPIRTRPWSLIFFALLVASACSDRATSSATDLGPDQMAADLETVDVRREATVRDVQVPHDLGGDEAFVDVGVDIGVDIGGDQGGDVWASSDGGGCAGALGLKPGVVCPSGAGWAACLPGSACYGLRECRVVPCNTQGFCSGALSFGGVIPLGYQPMVVDGTVSIDTANNRFTISGSGGSLPVKMVSSTPLKWPFVQGQKVKATLCQNSVSPNNFGSLLVVRDTQGALLLTSGVGNDASLAACFPAELSLQRHEVGCQPFVAPPPDSGGFLARFAFKLNGVVVEPGGPSKTISVGSASYDARLFEAYWYIEWQAPGAGVGAHESFVVLRR
jgi:hypothetical protein